MFPLVTDASLASDAALGAHARARIGSRLGGKWHLDALLGVGGTSAVYAATHRNGLRGAVKVLDAAYSLDPTMRKRFLREGTIANTVGHTGAVRVLDDDIAEDGCAYLVMELLDGETLEERAARTGGCFRVDEVMWVAWQILDVLAAAHEKGIVHRDIKPDNVFLTKDGEVKLLDFGLACLFEEAERGEAGAAGNVMGTPAFMAPEQTRGEWALVDAQSDVWSVGATMFALLTGRLVHGDEETAAGMMAAAFTRRAPSLATYLPWAPDALVQIVDCALEREKSKRFLDARSMQAAISTASAIASATPAAPPAPAAPAPSPQPAATRSSAAPLPSGRPSNDAIFSFTETRSPPPAGPRLRKRWVIALAAAAATIACTAAVILLAPGRPRAGSAALQVGAAVAPMDSAPVAPTPPFEPTAFEPTAPSDSSEVARPDAGAIPVTRRPAATTSAPARTARPVRWHGR
jgi:serine/threonine-protein kinase